MTAPLQPGGPQRDGSSHRDDPAAPPLRLPQFLGYAAGDAANNITFSMMGMFLLFYYTDVVGIGAAAAGTIYLLMRIGNAFADLPAGGLVDRTRTRWGKCRPYFLFGSVPLVALAVASFTVPGMVHATMTVRMVLALVTAGLMVCAYSMVNIPYGSLASAMAQDPGERAGLASFRVIGAALSAIVLAVVVAPQIKRFSGDPHQFQHALLITMIVLGVVAVGLYQFLFATSRERVRRSTAQVSLRQSLAILRSNRPLLVLCLSALTLLTATTCVQILQAYYARDVLGNAEDLIVLVVLGSGMVFVVAPFIPRLVRRFGKRASAQGFIVVGIAGAAGIIAGGSSAPLVFAAFGLWGIATGGLNSLMWALEADTVEYGEWRSGIRAEGSIYALFSFTRRIGMALGGALGAYGIGLGGYVAGRAEQSAQAVWAIRLTAGGGAALFLAVAFVILSRYPLTERVFSSLVADLAARSRPTPSSTSPD